MARFDAAKNQYVRGDADDDRVYTADGALTKSGGVHALAKTSAGAFTLVPPTTGEDGIELTVVARTAFAHTLTITEGIGGKGASFDVITFAAVGDSIVLLADNGHWIPKGAPYGAAIA